MTNEEKLKAYPLVSALGEWRTARVQTRLFDGTWCTRTDEYTFGTVTVRPDESLEDVRRRVARELGFRLDDVKLEIVLG